jgi:hypothetical protein
MCSAVGLAAITDPVDGDGVFRLVEDHAVVADAQPEQPLELAAERLDSTGTSSGVAMDGRQNIQGGTLLDGPDLLRNVRMKSNFLHWDSYSP